ncbi:MAG: DNA polymerase III subunit alpha [Cytophagaceae bacterium]
MYLNCHTHFSLKYGTMSPEALINEAKDKGVEALALTDIHNTSATLDFVRECNREGIKPLIGIEFRQEEKLLYVGIARNNEGFRELNEFLSRHNASGKPIPEKAPDFDHVYVIYPFGSKEPEELRENEFTGIKITELKKLFASPWLHQQDKMVMLHPVSFQNKTGYNTHRLLRAIHYNTLLSKLDTSQQASTDECMLNMDQLISSYSRFPKIIQTTMELVDDCNIQFDSSQKKNRQNYTGNLSDDKLLLEKFAVEGMYHRYGRNCRKEIRERLYRELDIIDKLGFNSYFLITWDIIRYAQNRNFFYVGRGSGANSLVAYCLKITDVDPIELDLYFERFLNLYRSSPPDFDIDFSWKDRDEVTDYIFKRYGQKNTVLLATYNTFKGRSIVRELGKVFGLPKSEIDSLTTSREPLKQAGRDHITKLIFQYAEHLKDVPSHLSIHAGGILITEQPVSYHTATDLPPKGFPITHFDMFTAEDSGFYKYDILSQRGLGHIKEAVEIVAKNRDKAIDISKISAFKKDLKVKENISSGNTIGCFYIESPGMRMLLKKLKCSDYLTLVAASSIIRPGVAQSGMMKQYIQRFHNPAEVKYLHPKMEELLKETYGVMIYQEDVIKVAHHFAGLDLAEADVLRRAMSGKYRSKKEFERVVNNFFSNCKAKGYPDELAKEVWRQIESFSGYSFSKAHSASFAVESYQSLYLKTHFPLEFMTAVINNMGGFYSTEFYVHEARMAGADIQACCINNSEITTCIKGNTIYLGFMHLKDVESGISERIITEREQNGEYKDLEDFMKRVLPGIEQVNILIRIGAFRFTGKNKKVLMWEANAWVYNCASRYNHPQLFETKAKKFNLPVLEQKRYEDAYDQMDLLGFPLCFPFDLLAPEHKVGITSDQMLSIVGKKVSIVGYFITVKEVYTIKNDIMAFAHFIDRKGLSFDTTHFPPSLKQFPLRGKGFYLIKGKIVEEFGYPSIEVDEMEKLPMVSLAC